MYGNTFDILDWNTLSGMFDIENLPSPPDVQYWDTSNLYVTGENTFVVPCLNWDMNCDGCTNLADYSKLALHWLDGPCSEENWFCDGSDLDKSGTVDYGDIEILIDHWLQGCQ